jgi:hypothetical protein
MLNTCWVIYIIGIIYLFSQAIYDPKLDELPTRKALNVLLVIAVWPVGVACLLIEKLYEALK